MDLIILAKRAAALISSGDHRQWDHANIASSNITGIVNGLFNPPSRYVTEKGSFYVECKAILPQFGGLIGNQTFWINPDDMIILSEIDKTGLCLTSVQKGGEGPYILGIAFPQNVVALFDVGAAKMRFAAHEY